MNLIIARVLFGTAAATFNRDISQLELLYTRDQIINTKERISNNVRSLVVNLYSSEPFKRFTIQNRR
jgi:hypothetical protein